MAAFNHKHSRSSPVAAATTSSVYANLPNSTSDRTDIGPDPRLELAQQLAEKEKRLQDSHSGIEKNVLVRQISQLQDKLAQGQQDSDQQRLSPATLDRLHSLERDLGAYRTSRQRKENPSTGRDQLPSPSASTISPPAHGDSTSLLPLPPPPTGSTPARRRSKVPTTDHKNTDIEFATEIGQGLLLEVRKMQALLQEKEEQLRALEIQKADLERTAESLTKQVRQKEESEEKLKEESWNLELKNQELTTRITELQQNLNKANVEQHKLAKQVNELTSDIERLRDREEKTAATVDAMKQRHELDMSTMRRHGAGLQREKAEQAKHIEALASELAIAKAQTKIAKRNHPDPDTVASSADEINNQENEASASGKMKKEGSNPGTTTPPSPQQTPARNQAMEVETLKTSLAHAHRMVSNLRSALHREKTDKFEFKKLLADSQETIEQLQNDPRLWVDAAGQSSRGTHSSNEPGTGSSGRKNRKGRSRTTPARKGRLARSHKDGEEEKLDEPAGRHRKNSQNLLDDSVYSYSSFNSEDESGLSEESDNEHPETGQFTPLSSELKQQPQPVRKPIVVDVQVNTEPFDLVLRNELAIVNNAGIDAAVDPISEHCSVEDGDTHAVTAVTDPVLKTMEVFSLPGVDIAPMLHDNRQDQGLVVQQSPDDIKDASFTTVGDDTQSAPSDANLHAKEATQDRLRSNEAYETPDETRGNDTPVPHAAAMTGEALVPHMRDGTDAGIPVSLIDSAPSSPVASHLVSRTCGPSADQKDPGNESNLMSGAPTQSHTAASPAGGSLEHGEGQTPQTETLNPEPVNMYSKLQVDAMVAAAVAAATALHKSQQGNTSRNTDGQRINTTSADGEPSQQPEHLADLPSQSSLGHQSDQGESIHRSSNSSIRTSLGIPPRPTSPPPAALVARATSYSPPAAALGSHRSMDRMSRPSSRLSLPTHKDSPSVFHRSAVTPRDAQYRDSREEIRTSPSLSSFGDDPNATFPLVQSNQSNQTEASAIPMITEIMIGDWLWKYTRRRPVAHNNRHQRYFWIHPYTRTLYWSTQAPGTESKAQKTKSAYIKRVSAVPDFSGPPNGPNVSILFETNGHPIKVTAPSLKRHMVWMESLNWLLSRGDSGSMLDAIKENVSSEEPLGVKRSISSGRLSLFKKSPSIAGLASSKKHKSLPSVASLIHKKDGEDDHEAMEDVRMCCNGKHHVSKLERDRVHRPKYRKRQSRAS